MRKVRIFIAFILLFITNLLNAQSSMTTLKVISINGLDDNVFEIIALRQSGDMIRLLSKKEMISDSCSYEKIREGAEYQFELKPEPAYVDDFMIRIGGTIYWKTGDDPKEIPFFANNIKSNYIKKQ